jgi:hypothetical protein
MQFPLEWEAGARDVAPGASYLNGGVLGCQANASRAAERGC